MKRKERIQKHQRKKLELFSELISVCKDWFPRVYRRAMSRERAMKFDTHTHRDKSALPWDLSVSPCTALLTLWSRFDWHSVRDNHSRMIHEEWVRQYLKNNPQSLIFSRKLKRRLTVGKEIANLSFCTDGTVTTVYGILLLIGAEHRSNTAKRNDDLVVVVTFTSISKPVRMSLLGHSWIRGSNQISPLLNGILLG